MYPAVLLLSAWLIAAASAQVLPASFDARRPSIGVIPNQGCCNANYALVPTAVMTDRACIQSNGTSTRVYSALDAIACCPDCSSSLLNKCAGGDPIKVWNYWTQTGLVSSSCMPYSLPPLCLGLTCPLLCASGSATTVTGSRVTGLGYYQVDSNVVAIKSEIFQNGPVEASINYTQDFLTVADLTGTDLIVVGLPILGQTSVKIFGWGRQNGIDYWLVSYVLGTQWGFQGTAKIPLGVDYLNIESSIRAGILSL